MSGYPVILGGDHAAFEIEHANTPPKERPDWPLPSFDAKDWAESFCKTAKERGHNIDESWMVTWFANALMRGYDQAAAEAENELESAQLRLTLVCQAAHNVVMECGPDSTPSNGSVERLRSFLPLAP